MGVGVGGDCDDSSDLHCQGHETCCRGNEACYNRKRTPEVSEGSSQAKENITTCEQMRTHVLILSL